MYRSNIELIHRNIPLQWTYNQNEGKNGCGTMNEMVDNRLGGMFALVVEFFK